MILLVINKEIEPLRSSLFCFNQDTISHQFVESHAIEHLQHKLVHYFDGLSRNCGKSSALASHRFVHYYDVMMSAIAPQITRLTIVYSTVYWGADQGKRQSSASLAFVRGVRRWPVNSPHKGPVTRQMFPFDDVIMTSWAPTVHSNAILFHYWNCAWFFVITTIRVNLKQHFNGFVE